LTEVFDRIHQKYADNLPLTNKSADRDLVAFMGEIIPDYDRERVYLSDIKKLVTWYKAVSSRLPYQPATVASEEATDAGTQQEQPAADEALSTAGIIPTETDSSAAANPEAAKS
jgi:hypothetical protein